MMIRPVISERMPTNLPRRDYKYTLTDFYKKYKKRRRKEGLRVKDIWTWKKYKAVMQDMLLATAKNIIEKKWVFIMPHGLGRLYIHSYKSKTLGKGRIDYKLTRERGGKPTRFISRTLGRIYVWKWCKKGASYKNKTFYVFKPVNSRKAGMAGGGRKGLAWNVKNKHKIDT